LPAPIKQVIQSNANVDFNKSFLTLIANTGNRFWDAMRQSDYAVKNYRATHQERHPVDDFTKNIVDELLAESAHKQDSLVLYPGSFHAPLMALGELAGWSTPSPLGLGLHSEYGPWFAYRALIKTDLPLIDAVGTTRTNESPCLSCTGTPCVSACPANAVSANTTFDIAACAQHRLQSTSGQPDCSTTCYSRRACPIGKEHSYSEEQLDYHMQFALAGLIKWANGA